MMAGYPKRTRKTLSAATEAPNPKHQAPLNSQPSTAAQRRPLRARSGRCVTQLYYARQGIITPEMEFIAIRENGNAEVSGQKSEVRNDLGFAHLGESFGANIPGEIT